MKEAALKRILSHSRKVGLDTSVLIYHFEGNEKYSTLTSLIFSAVAGGLEAVLSPMAVMEILVKPFQSGNAKTTDALIVQLRNMPNFTFMAADFNGAIEAARVRAKYGLRPPDALHFAASLAGGVDTFITNDAGFKAVDGKEKIKVLLLEDYLG